VRSRIAAIFVFAAFDGKRPAGFVSGYRFPSLTKECDVVYIYDVYVAPPTAGVVSGGNSWTACSPSAGEKAWPRPGSSADLDNPPAHRLFVGLGAKSHAEYIQFEFAFAPSREKES
jgi:hypothetical protein